jgi:uncharacterized protein (TIGR04255 family)
MRDVIHCERSTITEAWALVLGRATPVVPEEAAAIVFSAKQALPGLEREPAMVVAELPTHGPVAPFWSQQWSWNEGRFRARVGHRYLSVHRLADEKHPYDTYSHSLAPALEPWLDAHAKVHSHGLVLPAFEQIGYGYINDFRFPAEGFDLSKFFHVDFGVQLAGPLDGLDGVEFKFYYRDKVNHAAQVLIQIVVRPGDAVEDQLLVQTKVTATLGVRGFFSDRAQIEQEIHNAKTVAKRAFFDLATQATHDRMGAHYATPT